MTLGYIILISNWNMDYGILKTSLFANSSLVFSWNCPLEIDVFQLNWNGLGNCHFLLFFFLSPQCRLIILWSFMIWLYSTAFRSMLYAQRIWICIDFTVLFLQFPPPTHTPTPAKKRWKKRMVMWLFAWMDRSQHTEFCKKVIIYLWTSLVIRF